VGPGLAGVALTAGGATGGAAEGVPRGIVLCLCASSPEQALEPATTRRRRQASGRMGTTVATRIAEDKFHGGRGTAIRR